MRRSRGRSAVRRYTGRDHHARRSDARSRDRKRQGFPPAIRRRSSLGYRRRRTGRSRRPAADAPPGCVGIGASPLDAACRGKCEGVVTSRAAMRSCMSRSTISTAWTERLVCSASTIARLSVLAMALREHDLPEVPNGNPNRQYKGRDQQPAGDSPGPSESWQASHSAGDPGCCPMNGGRSHPTGIGHRCLTNC